MLVELLLDPQQAGVLYVGHREGVSRSVDGGKTWETRNRGLTNINIRALAISALDSQVLYAGTNGKGLFHTVDSGLSWKPVPLFASGDVSTTLFSWELMLQQLTAFLDWSQRMVRRRCRL